MINNSSLQVLGSKQLSPRKYIFDRLIKSPSTLAGIIFLASITLLSFSAPWISSEILHTDPNKQDLQNNLKPWFSRDHVLGTDELGRDVLTRVIFAGRISLLIGGAVALLQLIIGVPLGVLAGYYRGWIDDVINALLQIMRGIPIFYLLIVLSSLFKPNLFSLILVLGVIGWTGVCRQVRGIVLSLREREYIVAARALGASDHRIFFHHLLPNVSSIILVVTSFSVASTIITESSLSFLGFGVQAPTPSWGNMLNNALTGFTIAPWLIVVPGIFITATLLCIFQVADGIRDILDPHLV